MRRERSIYQTLIFIPVTFVISLLILHDSSIISFSQAAESSAEKKNVPEPVAVQPEANSLLNKMGEFLANKKSFSFHVEIMFDDMLPSGQKIQFSAAQDVSVKRPDKVYTKYASDVESREFWYDGKSFTLLDRNKNLYSTAEAEPTIDGTLEEIMSKYGYTPALSDFLYSDPYKTLMENVLSGFYVGPGDVNGTECYPLAFLEKYIDWQIWVEAGDKPLIRKVVITYKTVPESPQYIAVFSDWKFNKSLPDSLFEPVLPSGAKEINMMVLNNVSIKGEQ